MKVYESYVTESKARRRRRLAVGIVGLVMLATLAVTALLVLNPPAVAQSPLSAGCAAERQGLAQACDRVDRATAGRAG